MNKTSLYIWIDNLLSDGYTPEIRDLLQSFELSRKTNVPKKYKNIYLWNLQDYVGKILVEEVKAYSFSYHMSAIIK